MLQARSVTAGMIMKDSKTYTVGNNKLTDKNINRDYIGNLEIVKHDLEKMFRNLQKEADLNHDGKMKVELLTGHHRKLTIQKNSKNEKFSLSVTQDGKPVKLTRNDLISMQKQKERIEWRAEFYKGDREKMQTKVNDRVEQDRNSGSHVFENISDRLKHARMESQKDNAVREQTQQKEGKNKYDR